jgi:hypothetical protein
MRHKVINEVNQMREPDMFEPMLCYLQQDGYTVAWFVFKRRTA